MGKRSTTPGYVEKFPFIIGRSSDGTGNVNEKRCRKDDVHKIYNDGIKGA